MKEVALGLIEEGDKQWSIGEVRSRELGEKLRQDALRFADAATNFLPVLNEIRSVYEAYIGKDMISGRPLSQLDRSLAIFATITVGLARYVPTEAVELMLNVISEMGRRVLRPSAAHARHVAEILTRFGDRWPDYMHILRRAADAVYRTNPANPINNFNVGIVTRAEADLLGRAWVGNEATKLVEDGLEFFVSQDRLTMYRPPTFKPQLNRFQANLQRRLVPNGPWISNAHLDITD
jgi:hypothetical protein